MSYKKDLDTIDKQQSKIATYEKRFHDLIKSYKGLQIEKEALQSSLSALSNSPNDNNDKLKASTSNEEEKGQLETPESDTESIQSSADNQELVSLKRKIRTLQNSLKTLNAERNKNETLLKEDRKKLLEEKRKVEDDYKTLHASTSKTVKEAEKNLADTRNKLALCQQERDKEATNGITMLRELEVRLAKERQEKEELVSTLHELKDEFRNVSMVSKSNERDQKQITDLQNELEQVRNQLKNTVQQIQEPPLLKELQAQLQSMQIQYRQASIQEEKRSDVAQKNVRELSAAHEERVSSLENRLAELSLNAARYDRTKQSQLDTIHFLKDRIEEISDARQSEAINEAARQSDILATPTQVEPEMPMLIEELVNIWQQIQTLSEKSDVCVIESLLKDSDVIHQSCKRDYEKLMSEKESPVKTSACNCGLRSQVDDLRSRVRSLTSNAELTQKAHADQISTLTAEAATLRHLNDTQARNLDRNHQVSVAGFEQQLSEHRQRSLDTLQDREQEIHRLSLEIHQMNKEAQVQPRTVAAALLEQVGGGGGGVVEGPLLHHWEEMARKDIEVTDLRRDKRQLERALRDVQTASIERQGSLSHRIEILEREVSRQTRNVSREGENLEYLKNVVLQYMTSSEAHSRHMMLNAISAVLKFTPQEVESVRSFLELWWWQGNPKSAKANSRHGSTS